MNDVATVRQSDDAIDRFEAELMKHGGQVAEIGTGVTLCPVTHRFTPGLYIREIFMPAGTVLTSKIHKTEHPFAILSGIVDVMDDGTTVRLSAPYIGITMPGTRRVLYIIEDCRWATFHVTEKRDIAAIEQDIIEYRVNPHLLPELESST